MLTHHSVAEVVHCSSWYLSESQRYSDKKNGECFPWKRISVQLTNLYSLWKLKFTTKYFFWGKKNEAKWVHLRDKKYSDLVYKHHIFETKNIQTYYISIIAFQTNDIFFQRTSKYCYSLRCLISLTMQDTFVFKMPLDNMRSLWSMVCVHLAANSC
jgi:hypothetical protein